MLLPTRVRAASTTSLGPSPTAPSNKPGPSTSPPTASRIPERSTASISNRFTSASPAASSSNSPRVAPASLRTARAWNISANASRSRPSWKNSAAKSSVAFARSPCLRQVSPQTIQGRDGCPGRPPLHRGRTAIRSSHKLSEDGDGASRPFLDELGGLCARLFLLVLLRQRSDSERNGATSPGRRHRTSVHVVRSSVYDPGR